MKHRLPLCRNITFAVFFFFFLQRENTFNIQAQSDHSVLTASFLISEFSSDFLPVLVLCPCDWTQAQKTHTPLNAPWLSPTGDQQGFFHHLHPLFLPQYWGWWGLFTAGEHGSGINCGEEGIEEGLEGKPSSSESRFYHTPPLAGDFLTPICKMGLTIPLWLTSGEE